MQSVAAVPKSVSLAFRATLYKGLTEGLLRRSQRVTFPVFFGKSVHLAGEQRVPFFERLWYVPAGIEPTTSQVKDGCTNH